MKTHATCRYIFWVARAIRCAVCLVFFGCLAANTFAQTANLQIVAGNPNYGLHSLTLTVDNKPIRISGNGQIAGVPANTTVVRRDDGKARSVTLNSKTIQLDYTTDQKISSFVVNNQKYVLLYLPNNNLKSITSNGSTALFVYYPNGLLKTLQNNLPNVAVSWADF